ncbi:MAG: N-6 DNA methylase [Planctomycetota bacterium]
MGIRRLRPDPRHPPFKGSLDEEDVHKTLTGKVKTKKTELLFLVLMLRMLKLGGRCAVIVPDSVLFGSSKAHIAVRKLLVEDHQLEACDQTSRWRLQTLCRC